MTAAITYPFHFVRSFWHGFFHGSVPHSRVMRQERELRNDLGEDKVDAMVDDTFPASDPPSTY